MDWVVGMLGTLSDVAVLLIGATLTGTVAVVIAWLSHQLLFAGKEDPASGNAKLAELVHGSLLAFTVFTLALVLADVRSNLGKTLDSTLREASILSRLDEQFVVAGGTEADGARRDVRAYVSAVTTADWPALAAREPSLSRKADEAMVALRASALAVAKANPDYAGAINSFLSQIEDYRLGRLESATKTVTNVFWWIICAFLLAAMVMNGRYPSNRGSRTLIFLHMAGIGLVLALILVMDQPFRGETSVSPDPLARILENHSK